jgi:hypothetical protein
MLDRRSCSCGEVDVPAEEIPPGGEGTVTIRWSPIPGNVGPYRLTAEVQTNDPDTPLVRFEVQGKIAAGACAARDLVVHRLPHDQPDRSPSPS